MKIFCGTDITEISRIKEAIERNGERFIHEIFTQKEIEYCESKHNAKYEHYAARFAGKEAIYKAISPLLHDKFEVSWQDAEILNDETGKPYFRLSNVDFANRIKDTDISISHSRENAIVNVVILYE